MSFKGKLNALGKKGYWAAFNALHQRTFHDAYPVHYLYRRGTSDALVVVFSAYASGLKPTYNYVRTLWGHTDAHLLFIRDDFINLPSGGGYYIGKNGDDRGLQAVQTLIRQIRQKSGATRLFGIGSSKGGTAALLFGTLLPFDTVIIGAPQYYIGTYMQEHKPDSFALLTGRDVPSPQDIARYDAIVPHAVRECTAPPRVYIHYSSKEHTYAEHIADMLQDMKQYGFCVTEDKADYEKHTDVYLHYIPYMTRMLPCLLAERSSSDA